MKLEIGYHSKFDVREYAFSCGLTNRVTVLYLSDLHFNGYSKAMAIAVYKRIQTLNPDIIFFGGDYVDTAAGMKYFQQLLCEVGLRANVYAIAGNHDYFFGIRHILQCFMNAGIQWIEQQSIVTEVRGVRIAIDGSKPVNTPSTAHVRILCLHQPVDFKDLAHWYDVALAGHLHGCQFVGWQKGDALYPGKWLYKWNVLQQQIGKCRLLISKGLGDTLPIRFNCPKDILFVTID